MKQTGLLVGMSLLVAMVCSTTAGDLAVKVTEKKAPKAVSEAIQKTLEPKAFQVLEGGKPIFEFWFRSDTPLKSKPESAAKGLDAMDEVALVGVAMVGEGRRDYKDGEIPPGTYTMRFSLQPQDGDHLGTSDYPYFLVLIPAANDTQLQGIKTYRAMVKTSSKAAPSGHPLVLSLRPASGEPGEMPRLTEPAPEHHAVQIKIPGKVPDSDQTGEIMFDLVIEGRFKG